MTLLKNGTNTSPSSVTNIISFGFWILIDNKEYFIPFDLYPVFKETSIKNILNVKQISPKQLYWEDLDCDIEIDALEKPEIFPLIYK